MARSCGVLSSFSSCCLLLCLLVPCAVAQYTPDDVAGVRPNESYHHSDIDSVNLGNGNLVLHIPLISYPQRGSDLKVDFQLLYNGRWAQKQETCVEPIDTCSPVSYRFAQVQPYVASGVYLAEIHGASVVNKTITFTYPYSATRRQ